MSLWFWGIVALLVIMAAGNVVLCLPDKWPRNRRGKRENGGTGDKNH